MTRRWLALTLELGSLRELLLSVVKDAEPTPFAALRAGFQRTDSERKPSYLEASVTRLRQPNGPMQALQSRAKWRAIAQSRERTREERRISDDKTVLGFG